MNAKYQAGNNTQPTLNRSMTSKLLCTPNNSWNNKIRQNNELDTTNVEPTSHVLKMRNVMREDIPEPGMPREEILKNAPDHKDGLFKVPSILE